MDIDKIVTLLQETHNNANVLDFYQSMLQKYNKDLPAITHIFKHDIVNTCLYLLYLSNSMQNDIIQKKDNYENRDTDIIAELTYFSLVGPLLTKHIADQNLAVDIFSVINEYFLNLNVHDTKFDMQEIVNLVKNCENKK